MNCGERTPGWGRSGDHDTGECAQRCWYGLPWCILAWARGGGAAVGTMTPRSVVGHGKPYICICVCNGAICVRAGGGMGPQWEPSHPGVQLAMGAFVWGMGPQWPQGDGWGGWGRSGNHHPQASNAPCCCEDRVLQQGWTPRGDVRVSAGRGDGAAVGAMTQGSGSRHCGPSEGPQWEP